MMGFLAGVAAVVFNIAAVVVLMQGVGSAYRIDELPQWLEQIAQHPYLSDAAAILFIVGVLALIPFGRVLARQLGTSPTTRFAFWALTLGASLNALGCTFPMFVAHQPKLALDWQVFWLHRAIELDAAFNLGIGLALCALGLAALRQPGMRLLSRYSIFAGLITLPVSLQFFAPWAARWLAVAGPIWLLAIAFWSAWLWRKRGS
jgi:hypothetical protein